MSTLEIGVVRIHRERHYPFNPDREDLGWVAVDPGDYEIQIDSEGWIRWLMSGYPVLGDNEIDKIGDGLFLVTPRVRKGPEKVTIFSRTFSTPEFGSFIHEAPEWSEGALSFHLHVEWPPPVPS
jgi:hypothetical protein